MVAILNLGFCFVPIYCVFSIFGKALPPFKATFLQEIFLRHQSYDISDVRRSQGLQKMVCNNGWCHLPERSCWRKMGFPFFWDGGSTKFAHFGLFFDLFDFNSSNSSGPCAFICWGRQMQWIWRSRREHGLSEKCWFGPYWHLHLAVRWSPENMGLLIWDGGSIKYGTIESRWFCLEIYFFRPILKVPRFRETT